MTKKPAKPYQHMTKTLLVRALTQRDRTIAKLEKRIAIDEAHKPVDTSPPRCATTLPRNPMPWECS